MTTIEELYQVIIERYELYEFLEVVGLELPELLDAWDGWIGNSNLLDDLGLLDSDEEE